MTCRDTPVNLGRPFHRLPIAPYQVGTLAVPHNRNTFVEGECLVPNTVSYEIACAINQSPHTVFLQPNKGTTVDHLCYALDLLPANLAQHKITTRVHDRPRAARETDFRHIINEVGRLLKNRLDHERAGLVDIP